MHNKYVHHAIYRELRALAHVRLRAVARDTLLDTTSLVHEFYIRLAGAGKIAVENRTQFFHYASRAMRTIIIDSIRRRCAERRGGGGWRIDLSDDMAAEPASAEAEILAVHQALDHLEAMDSRLARVVEMRYFGGMSEPEIASALGLTERTIRRDWRKARLLLAQALG